jgi:hypothetical protein
VLPDDPSQAVQQHAVALATRLGAPVLTGGVTCRVAYASGALSQLGRGQHVILLGTLSGNLFSQEFGSRLPRWLGRDGVVIIDGTQVALSEDRDLGLLEINDSPWNTAYGLLTVAGTTDEGLGFAVQSLLGQTELLGGDVAVVEAGPDEGRAQDLVIHASDTRPAAPIPEATAVADPALRARLAERWWR